MNWPSTYSSYKINSTTEKTTNENKQVMFVWHNLENIYFEIMRATV